MSRLVGVSALDEAVALQALERVVDLADVERPGRAGTAVELGAQLIPVARALVEDGEEALTNGHGISFPGIYFRVYAYREMSSIGFVIGVSAR